VQSAWPIVEQAAEFIDNWHIGFICEYLEALYSLQIQNLIINIPPGHAKSMICSVFFPTWVWIKTPAARFLGGSHAHDLAVRDAVRSRRLIQSSWYQDCFSDLFQMTGDQNVKSRYENEKTGHRVSISVDSGWTGHRGNYIVWDDPLDKNKKDSDAARELSNEAVKSTFGTRGDNPKEMRRLLIMQRLHDNDPTGHLLEEMKNNPKFPRFEHLVLPARYEPKRFFSSIGLSDPRTTPGELLFPQLFDEKVVSDTETLLGDGAAGELQQRPAPKGGAIYLREWFDGKNRYDATDKKFFNRIVARWLSFDTAFVDTNAADTTGMNVLELTPDYHLALRLAEWKKLQYPALVSEVSDQAKRWNYDGKLRGIIIENKGSGISLIQTLRQTDETAPLILSFNPGSDNKPARARQASTWCARDCILLPMPSEHVPWLFDFEELLFKFPNAKIDDPIDAFSQAILHLVNLIAEGWQFRTGKTKR